MSAMTDDTNFDECAAELTRLRHRASEAVRHLERRRSQASSSPSTFAMREVRRLTIEHDRMLSRIDELESLPPRPRR